MMTQEDIIGFRGQCLKKTRINEENWKDTKPVESIPLPQSAGSTETIHITELDAGSTYNFALKAKDEVLQTSKISNVAQVTTAIPRLSL